MHEIGLAGDIVRMVQDAAARDRFSRVAQLRLEAGALAGVEPDALRFALDALVPGTVLDGAEITIDEPPGTAWCGQCAATVEIGSRAEACPDCGGYPLRPTGGTELRVLDLVVVDD
jgi:hydrogenase nickel incorporation protein HypA/HybF